MLEKIETLQDLKNRLKKLRSNADAHASIGLTVALCEVITMQDEIINNLPANEKLAALKLIA